MHIHFRLAFVTYSRTCLWVTIYALRYIQFCVFLGFAYLVFFACWWVDKAGTFLRRFVCYRFFPFLGRVLMGWVDT